MDGHVDVDVVGHVDAHADAHADAHVDEDVNAIVIVTKAEVAAIAEQPANILESW